MGLPGWYGQCVCSLSTSCTLIGVYSFEKRNTWPHTIGIENCCHNLVRREEGSDSHIGKAEADWFELNSPDVFGKILNLSFINKKIVIEKGDHPSKGINKIFFNKE